MRVNNASMQFLFVTVPTPDGRTAVFNALDVVAVEPRITGAVIFFRGGDVLRVETTLTPAEVAAATEQAMLGLLGRMLTAAVQMAREAGF